MHLVINYKVYSDIVTALCPRGYAVNNLINSNKWTEIWGDGIKVGNEAWDDSNTISGDGWKSDWSAIDDNFICFGGTSNSPDKCKMCIGGIPNNSKTDWDLVDTISDSAIISFSTSFIILIASIITAVSLVTIGSGSSSGIFSGINQMQLLLLIPLFRIYLPIEILQFYCQLNWTLFSFSFMNLDSIPSFNFISSYFGGEQTDDNLYTIGVVDKSILVNMLSPFILFVLTAIAYSVIAIAARCAHSK